MNPYELLLPQLLAGAAIVFFALRAVRRAKQASAADLAEYEQRLQAEHDRYVAELRQKYAVPAARALRLDLDLADTDAVPDLGRVTADFAPLIARVGEIEANLGGRGMAVTGFRAEPGEVVLTFTPRDRADAAARLARVAEQINAAAGVALPPGVAAARALPV